jgi:hypothetical protein
MKVSIQIVDAGQYVCLDGENAGKLQNSITVRTPSGRLVPIPTSDETISHLIELLSEIVSGKEALHTDTREFTAQTETGDVPEFLAAPALGQIAEAPQKKSSVPGLGHGVSLDSKGYPIRGRNKSVESDEYGYPIVPAAAEPAPQVQIDDDEDPGEQI